MKHLITQRSLVSLKHYLSYVSGSDDELSRRSNSLSPEEPKTYRYTIRWVMLATLLICFTPVGYLNAQVVSTASVNGTVLDATGAAVPGATVTLTNTQTSVRRTTVSTGSGTYVLVDMLPGEYTLTVTKEGFAVAAQGAFKLDVDQTATFNFTLSVGNLESRVEVTAAAARVESSTAELGLEIGQSFMNDLPLNGRDFTQMLTLAPGASPANTSQNAGGGQVYPVGAASFPAMDGQQNRSNSFSIDGAPANESTFSTYSIAPTVDNIQEFKVETHNDEAQFGGVVGGVVNIATKTGTNQFHGTLWEFLRNNDLDSRYALAASVAPLKQNVFGGNVGGPVRLPHYNGRNKTFFFASYEGYRQLTTPSLSGLAIVPTAAELSGDLSSISNQIYNPWSTRPNPANPSQMIRDPFMCDASGNPLPVSNGLQAPGTACNKIPSSLIDPNMVKFAQTVWPKPLPGPLIEGLYNSLSYTENRLTQDQYNVRIDHTINESNNLWFRLTQVPYTASSPGAFAGLLSTRSTPAQNYAVNYLHTFSPTTVLNLEFAHNGVNNSTGTTLPALNANTVVGETSFNTQLACGLGSSQCLIPIVNVPGYISGGESFGNNTPMTSEWNVKGDFTKVRGSHTFKLGAYFMDNGFVGYGYVPEVDFATTETSNPLLAGTGSSFASFLLGVPDGGHRQLSHTYVRQQSAYGAYFQDQWKVTRKLTTNVGIRYDISYWPQIGQDFSTKAVGEIDLNNGTYLLQESVPACGTAPCIPGGLASQPDVVVSPNGHLWQTPKDNWQPRLGLAYRLDEKTSLRSAFGMFFDESAGIIQEMQGLAGDWPSVGGVVSVEDLNAASAGPPTVTAENPLVGVVGTTPAPTPFGITTWYRDPRQKNAYSEQWNFGVERALTSSTFLEADYVGAHSTRLTSGHYTNTAVTPGPGPIAPREPYPYIAGQYYDQSVGRSSYNAFQFKLEHRAGHGLAYLLSYTWSKTIDIACDGFFSVEGCEAQNPYNLNAEKSVTGYDLPQMLSFSAVYKLPQLSTDSSALRAAVNNWQIAGIFSAHSGLPYDVGVSGDPTNTGNENCCTGYGYERLNVVGNPKLSNPTVSEWFNTSAFAIPAVYTYGDESRNFLRAGHSTDLSLSLFKSFPVTEQKRFEFRVEAFNFPNHANWGSGIPDRNVNDPAYATNYSAGGEREIQMALKFYW